MPIAALLALLVTGCSGGGPGRAEPLPSAQPQERQALAAFQEWMRSRTTARLTHSDSSSTTFQSRPMKSTTTYAGVLDFRSRTGRVTGTSSHLGSDGVTSTDQIDQVFAGKDQ